MLEIHNADALATLRTLPSESVQCCVTSPPYWGLRDYGVAGQLGLEPTFDEYLSKLLAIFTQVRRVLRSDGTLWVNLGDAYCSGGGTGHQGKHGQRGDRSHTQRALLHHSSARLSVQSKDLLGIPWRVAFALQSHGWRLRSDIIWHKPNPMPESVRDRPTKSHEYLFLLSKHADYYYDAAAIQEPVTGTAKPRGHGIHAKAKFPSGWASHTERAHTEILGRYPQPKQNASFSSAIRHLVSRRNKRTVWTIPTAPFRGAHFATFPPALVQPCILAGSRPGDLVLDPFAGSGTTGCVALALGRRALLIELNPDYVRLIRARLRSSILKPVKTRKEP